MRLEVAPVAAPEQPARSEAHQILSVAPFRSSEVYNGTISAQAEASQTQQQEPAITAARTASTAVVENVGSLGAGDLPTKEVALLQHFILEQFSAAKQFVLRRHMFDGCPTAAPVHPLAWIYGWVFVAFSGAFFLAWAFAWAATHSGSAAADWGIVLGTALALDLFVVQVFRAWVLYVLSMDSIKPQMQAIYRMLHKVALAYAQDELGGSLVELRVCQHLSPACRAAHSEGLYTLAAATVLRRVNDADIAACHEKKARGLPVIATVALALPVAFSLLHDALGVVALGMLLPAFCDALLIMNRYFYAGAGLFILVPYLFAIVLYVLWVLVVVPARHQVKEQNKLMERKLPVVNHTCRNEEII